MIPTISKECSQFINESNGGFLLKNLPKSYHGFRKVKVRIKKRSDDFIEKFNEAFNDERDDLHNASVFAYTSADLLTSESDKEPFYIFPINGYKFLYNPLVENHQTFNKPELKSVVTDLMSSSYENSQLREAMSQKCEIILYNIPYYYGIRASLFETIDDYKNFIRD